MATPRERRYQKTREAILETARALVIENGPHGVSLREIARRIDYSPAGLYEYFDNKDDILCALSEQGFARFADYLKQVPTELPPMERLAQMGVAYLNFATDNPDEFLLIFAMLPNGPESFEHLAADESSAFIILLEAVNEAIAAEALYLPAEHTAPEFGYILWAQVHGMAMLKQTLFRNAEAEMDHVNRRMIDLMFKYFTTPGVIRNAT